MSTEKKNTENIDQNKSCEDCEYFVSSKQSGFIVGLDKCYGSPTGAVVDPNYARRFKQMCGVEAKWGKFFT